jgi:hypothetical protein
MPVDSISAPQGDSRRHPRSTVALAAELHHNSACAPVTIGNISRCGAMLKTPLVLSPAAAVRLVRGSMASEAKVIWCSGNRCGLEFPEEIQVGEWVLPLFSIGQRWIDQIVAFTKSGQSEPNVKQSPGGLLTPQCDQPQMMADLGLVLELLNDLKDDLTSSSDTLSQHGEDLRQLDAAIQMLSSDDLRRRSGPQLIEGLGEPFELLGRLEDEICCDETVARHSYKLQHLDFAMQMLEEVAASSLIGHGEQSSGPSRLPRLRTACEHALRPR